MEQNTQNTQDTQVEDSSSVSQISPSRSFINAKLVFLTLIIVAVGIGSYLALTSNSSTDSNSDKRGDSYTTNSVDGGKGSVKGNFACSDLLPGATGSKTADDDEGMNCWLGNDQRFGLGINFVVRWDDYFLSVANRSSQQSVYKDRLIEVGGVGSYAWSLQGHDDNKPTGLNFKSSNNRYVVQFMLLSPEDALALAQTVDAKLGNY